MSSHRKPQCFGSDIQRLLLAAEAGQRADILAYSSGHLGPHSLNQSQPSKETKQSFWRTSRSQEDIQKPLTRQLRRTKALVHEEKTEMKGSSAEFTSGTAAVESDVSGSSHDDRSSRADRKEISLPKRVYCLSKSLPVHPRGFSQKMSNSSYDKEASKKAHSSLTGQVGLNKEDRTKPQFWRQETAWIGPDQNSLGELNVGEIHERKLQKELKKLSEQSWPNRDHLAVFSDVFDDVCEASPVFGGILREIKVTATSLFQTDYDLYVNHLMASQSSLPRMSLHPPLRGLADRGAEVALAAEEVCRLEQEAREALEENIRVQNELQNVLAMTRPEDRDMNVLGDGEAAGVRSRRLQVLNIWKEVQRLEEEVKEMGPTPMETRVRDLKTEIMRLIVSNERLKTTNKCVEDNINLLLTREKASRDTTRMLWDEIQRAEATAPSREPGDLSSQQSL